MFFVTWRGYSFSFFSKWNPSSTHREVQSSKCFVGDCFCAVFCLGWVRPMFLFFCICRFHARTILWKLLKKIDIFLFRKAWKNRILFVVAFLFLIRHEAQTTGVELKRFDGIRVSGTFKKLIMWASEIFQKML